MSGNPEVCMIVDRRPEEPHPLARRYFDNESPSDWQEAAAEEMRNGFTVTLRLVDRERCGPDFDNRVSGGEAAH